MNRTVPALAIGIFLAGVLAFPLDAHAGQLQLVERFRSFFGSK